MPTLKELVDRGQIRPGYVPHEYDQEEIPVIPDIHKAVYEATAKPSALNMNNWHTCKTTHCVAGWVVHLAGEEGKRLEALMGVPTTARLIYAASDPSIDPYGDVPDFYTCDKEQVLARIKALAELEATRRNH